MKISVITVNYHNEAETIACLRSVDRLKKSKLKLEYMVVDNGASRKSSAYLAQMFPKAEIIPSKINLGFAGGNNLAIKKALADKADYVLLINPDTLVESSDFFQQLLSAKADIAAPVIKYLENGHLTYDIGGKVDYIFGRNTHLTAGKIRATLPVADYHTGACLLIKTSVFKTIGLLDEKFFLYYEDADFCLRAAKAGLSQKLSAGSVVFHHLSTTTSKLGRKKLRILADSHLLFCRHHLPFYSLPFYLAFNLFLRLKSVFF